MANYEAEWRQLTDMVEADRRAREARRQKEIAAREAQMAALFKQEFALSPSKQRRSTLRTPGTSGAGGAGAGGAAADKAAPAAPGDAALASTERVRQLKEEFTKVLAATGRCYLPACPPAHTSAKCFCYVLPQGNWDCVACVKLQRTLAAGCPGLPGGLTVLCSCPPVHPCPPLVQALPTSMSCLRRWWRQRRPTSACSTM